MKYIFTCLLMVWFVSSSKGQVVTVYEDDMREKLIGVVLQSDSPQVAVSTDVNGQADLTAFVGSENIQISYLGYQTLSLSYTQIKSDGFVVKMQVKSLEMTGVVISTNRTSSLAKEATQTVSVVSRQDVVLQNPQTAADLLGADGKVFIQKSQQGGGSPMIRGFATNRLLIAVDGVRMNTAIFRSGNLQNVISIDPLSLDRTEVLFGPGSVMYGSDAIGGVMGFFTAQPKLSVSDEPLVSGSAMARYASANNEFTTHLDAAIGRKKWAFYTSFTQNRFGDLRMGSHGPNDYLRPEYVRNVDGKDVILSNPDPQVQIPTGYSQTNFLQKVRFKPSQNLNVFYALHYSTTTNYDRYDRHIRYRRGFPRSAEWYYGPQKWTMHHVGLEHTRKLGVYDKLSVSLAGQLFEESRYDRDFNGNQLSERVENVAALSLNIDAHKAIGKSRLYYGIENVANDVQSLGRDHVTDSNGVVSINLGPSRYPQAMWQSHAAYATWKRSFGNLLFQVGGRYNLFAIDAEFDTTFYPFPYSEANLQKGALSGSLGLAYLVGQGGAVKLNLSTGFRSPNVDDMGKVFDSEPGSVVVPNPDLKAENAYNAEFVLEQSVNNRFMVQLVGYYTILQNAMVRRDFTLNGQDSIVYSGELSQVQAIQNAAYATVLGGQFQLKYRLAKGWEFNSQFNYQKGIEELEDGTVSALRHAGPWFGSSHLTYTHHPIMVDCYTVYNGTITYENLAVEEQGKDYLYAADANGNPYSPGWYTVNLKVMVQVNQNWTVSGGLENITDQRYRPYSSGIAAAGRNVILSVRSRF